VLELLSVSVHLSYFATVKHCSEKKQWFKLDMYIEVIVKCILKSVMYFQ